METFDGFERLVFVFAKTMPDNPHWYVVRTPENQELYVKLFETIREKGVDRKWGGRRYRYWFPGDGFKYWAMTSAVGQSRIINRAEVKEGEGPDDEPPEGGEGPAGGGESPRPKGPTDLALFQLF
jgi:hypothetical protein